MKLGKHFFSILVLLALVTASGATGVYAQDDGEPLCSEQDVSDAITAALAALEEAQGLPVAEQLAKVLEVKASLAAISGQCAGLDFEGNGPTVTDPYKIPPGAYRITLFSESSTVINGKVISGVCYEYKTDEFELIASFEPDPVDGVDAFLRVGEDCLMVWELQFVEGPFKVTFEKLD